MARAWRLCKSKHANNAFDGEGARLFGGRWSSPGTRVVYVSESLSLATLEVLVHLQHAPALADYVVFQIDFADELVEKLADGERPPTWRDYPAPAANQAVGDRWIQNGRSLVLRVPSAVIPREHNYLINPAHADFRNAVWQGPTPLDVDPRVLRR